mmetsp:Transcript_42588/g.67362  ORF Transcript_42588/g.67362 Transcript_42588/m.67362 type:complete len:188 (+) Transcript_42588:1297-1860(+)
MKKKQLRRKTTSGQKETKPKSRARHPIGFQSIIESTAGQEAKILLRAVICTACRAARDLPRTLQDSSFKGSQDVVIELTEKTMQLILEVSKRKDTRAFRVSGHQPKEMSTKRVLQPMLMKMPLVCFQPISIPDKHNLGRSIENAPMLGSLQGSLHMIDLNPKFTRTRLIELACYLMGLRGRTKKTRM